MCVWLCGFSLIAPVQADGDVSLYVPTLVLGQVTRQQLPPQVDELHHDEAELVEQLYLVLLVGTEGQCYSCRKAPGGGGATVKQL